MPPPDKIRRLIERACSDPECEFSSTQEWAWWRHEAETGHTMQPMPPPPLAPSYAPRIV